MNTTSSLKRMDGPVNYPFKAGALESAFFMLRYGNVPGIEITDEKAFVDYVEKTCIDLHNRAVKFERGEF